MKRYAKLIALFLIVFLVVSMFPTKTVSAAAVKLNTQKITISVGQTYGLKMTGTSAKATWKSEDKKIATVSSAGKVTAVSPGKTTIVATVGKKKYSCSVTVEKTGFVVSMLDVGQGEAILIQVNNQNILIDCGEERYYKELTEQLEHFKVKTIQTLILTHPNSDHIGAADLVISKYKPKTVYMPRWENDTREYSELLESLEKVKTEPVIPQTGDCLLLGAGVSAKFLAVDTEKDNNGCSIVLRMDYYENSFLFTGDATAKVENTLLEKEDIDVDVLKVAHHGSDSASPVLYLKTVSPKYALISCGIDNSYGHPNKNVIRRLEKYSEHILRTDESGTITIRSDGEKLESETEHIIDWNLTEKTTDNTPEQTTPPVTGRVIGNKNSKIYHYPSCSTLPAEKNRIYFSSAEEAEKAGYRKCKKG